ncbi:AAA family ATPase [Enterovirga sp. GCM10030262]|uniref:AAA family ATPase n=1 Tax=Enterovirga sp. GCM10030262 TaxID=3273391 RepID=UPI0036077585
MQIYDRTDEPAPACLSDSRTSSAREALQQLFGDRSGRVEQTKVYFSSLAIDEPELRSGLERLFRKRCAFCERETETRPYRFRPTEEAGPSSAAPSADADRSHLYYTWLANAWQNIYSICSDCHPYEPSIFPILGRRCALPTFEEIDQYANEPTGTWRGRIIEKQMFLDPCAKEDLRKHLAVLPDGSMRPLSQRGGATLHHFNLDRPDLSSERAESMGRLIEGLLREDGPEPDTFNFEDGPHGGARFLLLYQIARKIGGGGGGRPTLSRWRIGRHFEDRLKRPGFRRQVEAAIDDLFQRPDQDLGQSSTSARTPIGTAKPVRFHIRNFKAIEELEVTMPPRPLARSDQETAPAAAMVIIGENAAGKSSILEAIALALSDSVARTDLSQEAAKFMLDPSLMGAGTAMGQRDAVVAVEYEDGGSASLKIGDAGMSDNVAAHARIPVFAYGAFRLYLDSAKVPTAASGIRSLFESNYVLPNPERWLTSIHETPLFNEVVRSLREVLALDQKFDVLEVDPVTSRCTIVMTTERAGLPPLQTRTPLRSVSSGFRSVLSMVCDVMQRLALSQGRRGASLAKAHAVVLIDEVEAHLHPRWKMRIIGGLRKALPNVTFIVTTHDPLCLRGLDGGEVTVLRRIQREDPGRGELPEFVEQLETLPAIGALTIEQLLTSDLFQLFSTDAPETESGLAAVGDLLARDLTGERLAIPEEQRLQQIRASIREQIAKSLPIGSTDVERLVQEAVEEYLRRREVTRAADLKKLREDTRGKIVAALERI